MAADSPITQEIQSIKTKAAGPDMHSALQEVQADWHNHASNAADLQQFTQQLQASGALPTLALEYGKELISAPNSAPNTALDLQGVQQLQQTAGTKGDALGQMMFGQLATDWDKNKDASGKLTAAQIDVDLKASTAVAGQPPAAATEAAFTRPIAAKEGPYQPIAAAHPDWKPHQVLDEAHKVKAALGQGHVYRQGEQLRVNADGSVTSRLPDRHTPGNFDETDMNGGKKVSERTGDDKGNWVKTTFGDDGKPTGSTEHAQQADGSFTETSKGTDGKPTGTLEHKVNSDGTTDDTTKGADGTTSQTIHTNADKSTIKTDYDPQNPGNSTETHTGPDGKVTGSVEHKVNADTSTDDTTKGADGSVAQTVHTNADKSTVTTVFDAQNPGNYTETQAGPDGKATGTAEFKKNTDNSTDRTEKDAGGNPTKSIHTNPDGSTDTVDYKDGKPNGHTVKTQDANNSKIYSSISYDQAGKQVAGDKGDANGDTHQWSTDAQGNHTKVETVNGVKTTTVNDKNNQLVSTQIVTHENGKIVTVTKKPGQADVRDEQPEPQAAPA